MASITGWQTGAALSEKKRIATLEAVKCLKSTSRRVTIDPKTMPDDMAREQLM
jgi:hypothetical protein